MIIKNGRVFNDGFKFENADIITKGDSIDNIGKFSTESVTDEIIDASNCYIIPGFIDVHTHGARGNDFTNIDNCDVNEVSSFYASKGVTSFLATTMTDRKEKLVKVLDVLGAIGEGDLPGAKMAGIHLEGPFISPKACGAQPPECIQEPGAEAFREYYEASQSKIKIVTMSPESDNAAEMIKYARSLGVVCSCGHTRATYQEATESIKLGVTHATHFFNAMTGLHHREPGAVGAFFDAADATVEMISDLIHLHPCVLRTIYKVKGADKVIGVTDSIEATGMEDGTYKLGLQNVTTKDGIATLEDGTLAGSTLTMDLALRNMVNKVGLPLEDAVRILTNNPAKLINANNIGLLKNGYKADITILDSDLKVKYTIVNGKIVYKA